mmetsp:Transcript_26558/g.58214  ORF Transcript_26558/g.58214 Transcript_26558/m.58214 type:complete len:203 (-) Transcript_26558:64-672(-)
MSVQGLTALLLDHIRHGSLQNSWCSLGKSGAVLLVNLQSMSSSLNSVKSNSLVLNEWVECPDCVRSTTDTGNDGIGKLSGLFKHLFLHFLTHNALKVTHDNGEGGRSDGGTNEIVSIPHVRYPISHGLIDGILQGALSILDGNNLGTESVHTEYVELLTFAVDGTHVYGAVKTQHGTDSSSSNTVLPGASFGNDARLANALG